MLLERQISKGGAVLSNRTNFNINDNAQYDGEIPKLLNYDYADAALVFNPLLQRIIDNIHAVKMQIDNLPADGGLNSDVVNSIIANIKDLQKIAAYLTEKASETEKLWNTVVELKQQVDELSKEMPVIESETVGNDTIISISRKEV